MLNFKPLHVAIPNPAPTVVEVDPHEPAVIVPVLDNDTAAPPIRFPNESRTDTVGAGAMTAPATVSDGPCTNATVAAVELAETTKVELTTDTAPDAAVIV